MVILETHNRTEFSQPIRLSPYSPANFVECFRAILSISLHLERHMLEVGLRRHPSQRMLGGAKDQICAQGSFPSVMMYCWISPFAPKLGREIDKSYDIAFQRCNITAYQMRCSNSIGLKSSAKIRNEHGHEDCFYAT